MKKLHKKALVGALIGAAIGVMQYEVIVVQAAEIGKSPTCCK